MLKALAKIDRLFGLSHRMLLMSQRKKNIYILNKAENFLEKYLKFYKITALDAATIINKFRIRYLDDIDRYIKTGQYPYQYYKSKKNFNLTRTEYDIVLISSVLTSKHRLKIMSYINSMCLIDRKVGVIGVGSGIELLYMNGNNINAFDLSISNFAKRNFNDVNFFESKFKSFNNNYDIIFAIEILEHLSNPFLLLNKLYNSLKPKGVAVLTTTTNFPQFDHLYDFKNKELIKKLKDMGFIIVKKIELKHESNFNKINTFNTFFILKKKR
jgi:2-polyprenyl-3-methyl-5-hydroxy-6-metoxy-1,4-benzoquinol methylase